MNVSDLIHLGETGAWKSEDVLPKFGVRSGLLGSWALSELRCVVVIVPPSYAETLEAVSPEAACLSEANAVHHKQKNDSVPYRDSRNPQKLSKDPLRRSGLRACSV